MAAYTMQDVRSVVSTMLLGAQREAVRSGQIGTRPFVDLTAGLVHKIWIGGLKPNRMPMVCNAIRQLMRPNAGDVVL